MKHKQNLILLFIGLILFCFFSTVYDFSLKQVNLQKLKNDYDKIPLRAIEEKLLAVVYIMWNKIEGYQTPYQEIIKNIRQNDKEFHIVELVEDIKKYKIKSHANKRKLFKAKAMSSNTVDRVKKLILESEKQLEEINMKIEDFFMKRKSAPISFVKRILRNRVLLQNDMTRGDSMKKLSNFVHEIIANLFQNKSNRQGKDLSFIEKKGYQYKNVKHMRISEDDIFRSFPKRKKGDYSLAIPTQYCRPLTAKELEEHIMKIIPYEVRKARLSAKEKSDDQAQKTNTTMTTSDDRKKEGMVVATKEIGKYQLERDKMKYALDSELKKKKQGGRYVVKSESNEIESDPREREEIRSTKRGQLILNPNFRRIAMIFVRTYGTEEQIKKIKL